MKKLVSIIVALGTIAVLNAQEYLHIDSHWHGATISIAEIDSITYGPFALGSLLTVITWLQP